MINFEKMGFYDIFMTNAKEIHKNTGIRHIDLQKCICYNCHRQKSNYAFIAKNEAPGCTGTTIRGFFLFFRMVKHPSGYLLSSSFLSSHLQMRWQVTPAATVTKKVIMAFIAFTSSRCRVSVGQQHDYNIS